jgi:Zn-dependent oligopeptidase
MSRQNDNGPVINEILTLCQELAKLLSCSYAELDGQQNG